MKLTHVILKEHDATNSNMKTVGSGKEIPNHDVNAVGVPLSNGPSQRFDESDWSDADAEGEVYDPDKEENNQSTYLIHFMRQFANLK